ncbi:MAG: hypothetical protein HFF03_07025 [Oscillospiraceae bacterium]|jgi:hypothetical protein|nr:hypothetical protein [Oscillospiraceae bacterium]
MGLFDKLKEKIAPQEPTLMEEIPKAEAWLKENMERFGQPLDGTHESFAVLDVFFEEQCKPGGLLAGKVRYMKNQLFAVGAYVGQVLVNELGGTWVTDDKAREGEALIGVQLPDGRMARPVQRAIRCFNREPGYTFVDFWDIVSNPPKPREEAEETPLEAETSEEGVPQESEAETPKAKGKRKLFGRREKSEE